MTCYNAGVTAEEHVQFEDAIKWLEESIQLFDIIPPPKDMSKQARTLRLLANCFLSLGNYDRALTSIRMANEVGSAELVSVIGAFALHIDVSSPFRPLHPTSPSIANERTRRCNECFGITRSAPGCHSFVVCC